MHSYEVRISVIVLEVIVNTLIGDKVGWLHRIGIRFVSRYSGRQGTFYCYY